MYANERSQTKFTACWKGRVVWVVAITMHCVASTIHMLVVKGSREWRRTTPLKWSNWWLRGCLKSWNPKPSKRNLGKSSMWVSSIRKIHSCMPVWRRFSKANCLHVADGAGSGDEQLRCKATKPNVANVYLFNLLSLLSPCCIFIIFNFFWRSNVTRCCWLPWWSDWSTAEHWACKQSKTELQDNKKWKSTGRWLTNCMSRNVKL